jgi:predicted unusual protein kinase regulating ubiquinone biosynthesis (AarF/ABC1/UbiB family)
LQSTDDDTTGKISRFGESCTNDGIWEANYEISARFLYLGIFRLRGLWTKTAQYMSSRADFMPVSYIRELSKLQDQAPATEWKEVEVMLKRLQNFEKLADIEETPIASASIGQVHVARLAATKEKVAIKVQHPHAQRLMTDDFWSLQVLTKVLTWLEPEYAFMENLIREWSLEARKELDFRFEADHLRDARKALESMYYDDETSNNGNEAKQQQLLYTTGGVPFQVEVPEPLDDLCNRDVLVMHFCEGCRVDDFAQIQEWKLSRDAIMDAISRTFAHFMYCSTIFNGDPHAGNIMVRPGTSVDPTQGFTITILDWGLAKRLPESKRLAFCQMVYAAATLDYGLLLDSYKLVGLKMKREDAGQSMEDVRFFLRDMAPRESARDRLKKRIRSDVVRCILKRDVSYVSMCFRISQKSMVFAQEKAKKTKEKVPMESKAYPGEFFFFIRVNELLHGLGSRFDVNLSYLDTLRPYAERGLRQSSIYDLKSETLKTTTSPAEIQNAELQQSLQAVLKELEDEGSLVGGQVCVLDKDGKMEANIVAGSLGGLRSHIPMQEDALILGFSTTKAIASTVAHIMVEEGYLTYDEPICERVWKAFCPTKYPNADVGKAMRKPIEETVKRWQWKRQITLRHILNHAAGFGFSLPNKLSIKKLASCEECFASYEYNPKVPEDILLPTHAPGEKTEYHIMSFGWLVAGTLCGAYSLKRHKGSVATFAEVYRSVLEKRLSPETTTSGFRPVGITSDGSAPLPVAQTVTSDIRASSMMQRMRDNTTDSSAPSLGQLDQDGPASEMFKTFRGKEFLVS